MRWLMSAGFLPSTEASSIISSWSPTSMTPQWCAGPPATSSCTCTLCGIPRSGAWRLLRGAVVFRLGLATAAARVARPPGPPALPHTTHGRSHNELPVEAHANADVPAGGRGRHVGALHGEARMVLCSKDTGSPDCSENRATPLLLRKCQRRE